MAQEAKKKVGGNHSEETIGFLGEIARRHRSYRAFVATKLYLHFLPPPVEVRVRQVCAAISESKNFACQGGEGGKSPHM